jgi:L-rhamnose-H+ transport protein
MSIFLALLLVSFGGIINGSFALPTKHIKHWSFENIWLQYSIFSFLLLPWIAAMIFAPHIFSVYAAVPAKSIWTMAIGGFLFGAGQIGFAFAMSMIGFGLTFVICVGLGTVLGFLLPLIVQHPEKIATPFGVVTIIGGVLALVGLIVATYAGNLRDKHRRGIIATIKDKVKNAIEPKSYYFVGVFLAILAGLFSAGQNFAFSLTVNMQTVALAHGISPLGAANIMWPGFLFFSFLPYAGYMLWLHYKNQSFGNYGKVGTAKYYLFALIMGACWYGSLICYSKASQLIGTIGPIVGWPLFMVAIILTSNFLGWKHGEWENCGAQAKSTVRTGLTFLILSILILGYSAVLA